MDHAPALPRASILPAGTISRPASDNASRIHLAICFASSGFIRFSSWSLWASQMALAIIKFTWCGSVIRSSRVWPIADSPVIWSWTGYSGVCLFSNWGDALAAAGTTLSKPHWVPKALAKRTFRRHSRDQSVRRHGVRWRRASYNLVSRASAARRPNKGEHWTEIPSPVQCGYYGSEPTRSVCSDSYRGCIRTNRWALSGAPAPNDRAVAGASCPSIAWGDPWHTLLRYIRISQALRTPHGGRWQ